MTRSEAKIRFMNSQTGFIISVILLCGLGLLTLYFSSATSAMRLFDDEAYYLKRQLVIGLLGTMVAVVISSVNLETFRSLFFPMVLIVMLLCILTTIPGIGIEKNGARRWLGLGPLVFQPAELAKLMTVCYLAHILDKKYDRIQENMFALFPAITVLGMFVCIIFLQDDFSSTVFIFILGIVMLFFAGIKLRLFFTLFIFAVPVAFLFIFVEPYRVYRIISYLKPKLDPYGINYQTLVAQNAIHSSGFWGKGIGGILRKDSIIPEVQSDFIFAGWVEQWGLFGVIVYFLLLSYMLICGMRIAVESENRFKGLIVIGSVSAIFFQSVLNCGVVSGVFPSTGIPLPFFSSGGTSLAITLAFCGIVINISKSNLRVRLDYE